MSNELTDIQNRIKAVNNPGPNAESDNKKEGFTNMNIFGLQINRTCLILMIIYTLIIMYKEDIMKTQFVKNILK